MATSASNIVPYPEPVHNGNLFDDSSEGQDTSMDGINTRLQQLGSVNVKDSKVIHIGPAIHYHLPNPKGTISQLADPNIALMYNHSPKAVTEEHHHPEKDQDSEYEWVLHYPPSASECQTDDENKAESPAPIVKDPQGTEEQRYILSDFTDACNDSQNIHKVEDVTPDAGEHFQSKSLSTNPFLVIAEPLETDMIPPVAPESTSHDQYNHLGDNVPKSDYSVPVFALNKSFTSQNVKTDGNLFEPDTESHHTSQFPSVNHGISNNNQNKKHSVNVPSALSKTNVELMHSSSVSSPEPHILKNNAEHFPTFFDSHWATFKTPHSETSEESWSPSVNSPSENQSVFTSVNSPSENQSVFSHDTTTSHNTNPFLERVKIEEKDDDDDDEADRTGWELLGSKYIEKNGFRLGISPGTFYKSKHGIFVELCHGTQYEIVLSNQNAIQCDIDLYVENAAMIPLRVEGDKSVVLQGPPNSEKRFVFLRSRDAPREANIVPGNKNNGRIRAVFLPEEMESPRTRTASEPLTFTRSLENIMGALGIGKENRRSRSATGDWISSISDWIPSFSSLTHSSHLERGFDYSAFCEGATALQGKQKPKKLVKVESIVVDKGRKVELQLRLFGRTDDPSVPSEEEISSLCPPPIEDLFRRKN